jgi:hypothetical protein
MSQEQRMEDDEAIYREKTSAYSRDHQRVAGGFLRRISERSE